MRLSYAVELRPALPVPVRLLEKRIALDLERNLKAIRRHVHGLQRGQTQEEEKAEGLGVVVVSSSVI